MVRIGGHGEMTMIPGWPAMCHTFTRLTSTELNLFEGFSTLGWLRWWTAEKPSPRGPPSNRLRYPCTADGRSRQAPIAARQKRGVAIALGCELLMKYAHNAHAG
jgi:hypothetical protein